MMCQLTENVEKYWRLRGIVPPPHYVIRPNARWTGKYDAIYQTMLLDGRWQDWQWSQIKLPDVKWKRMSFSNAELVAPRQYVYVPQAFKSLQHRVIYVMEGLPDTQTMHVNGKAAIGLFNNSIVKQSNCVSQLREVLAHLQPTGIIICHHHDAWNERFPELTTVRVWWDVLRPVCEKFAAVRFLDIARLGVNDWNDVWRQARFDRQIFTKYVSQCLCGTPQMPMVPKKVAKPPVRRVITQQQKKYDDLEQHIRAKDMVTFAEQHAPSPNHGVKQVGNKWKILGNGGFWITQEKKWSIGCYKGCPGGKTMISLWKYLKYGDFNVPTQQVLPEIRAYFGIC